MTAVAYIERLRVSPLRPRGPLPRVSPRLVEAIRQHGVIEPIVVRPSGTEHYEILANLEMWMAAQQVRIDQVPIFVLDDLTDDDARQIMEDAARGFKVDPIEEAEFLLERVNELQPSSRYRAIAKLSYMTGLSRTYISHSLRLLKLPLSIQSMVQDKSISPGHARALVCAGDKSAQMRLAEKTKRHQWSVRRLEAEARQAREEGPTVATRSGELTTGRKDPSVIQLERKLGEQLGCKVDIQADAGSMTIQYYSLDILDGILQKIGVASN